MLPSTRVQLFGSFRLLYDDEEVAGLNQARLQELVAYLVLHRNRSVARPHLAFLFWPDSTEEQARTNLRNLWHRLRHTLPHSDEFLSADEMAVQWREHPACHVDVAEFEDGLREAGHAHTGSERVEALSRAVSVYAGELLPGFYSEWLLAERDRLAEAYGGALAQLASLCEERGDYRHAIGHVQALVRHDPLNEAAYAQLMRLYAVNGDRAAALHIYHTCATLLRRELDVEPGPRTREIYDRLLNFARDPAPPERGEATVPLVGREAEWAQLQQSWRRATGSARLLLVSGEAGIGKTRLAEALVEWLTRQGIPALTAHCYAAGGDIAYAPIVTWLRAQPRPPLPDAALRELARLLPEVPAERPDLPAPEPLAENWQRLRLFEALTQAMLASRTALLLFLDDLQWCDRDTLDWLHYLLTGPAVKHSKVQLLLLATCRCDAQASDSPLETWKADLTRVNRFSELPLGPLDEAATLSLANCVAGQQFDPDLSAALYASTEGHPLFVVEMVRAAAGVAGAATAAHAAEMLIEPTALPHRVRQVLEARLAQLSPAARAVTEVASVAGRAFSFEILARAADEDEQSLVACLDECWRKRIIREQGENAYDFSHEKLREAAYSGLSRTRRRWLHRRVGTALEQIHARDLDRAAGVIAAHFQAAGLPRQAIDHYARAARLARSVYAHSEALAELDKAITLAEALPDPADRCRLIAGLCEQVGDTEELLAHHARARRAYLSALDCTGEREIVSRARLHRKIGKTLENERATYDQVAAEYDAAEDLLGHPGAFESPAWWEEWCQVQLEHLIHLYWWNRPEDMARRIDFARPLIETHGTPYQKAALFSNLARQETRSNRFAPSPGAVDYARASLAALPASAAPEARAPHQFALGFYVLWNGDPVEAEQILLAALNLAELTGDVTVQTRCLTYLGVSRRRRGDVAGAEAYARQGLALAEAAAAADYVGSNLGSLAWVAECRGDQAEAERLGRAALEAWRHYGAPHPLYWQALWPLVSVSLAENRLDDAFSFARQLLDPDQQRLPPSIEESLFAALTSWDAGRGKEARALLHSALELARQAHFD